MLAGQSLGGVLFGGLVKLGLATLGAEIDGLAFVFAGGRSLFRVDRHFANRINNFHRSSSSLLGLKEIISLQHLQNGMAIPLGVSGN